MTGDNVCDMKRREERVVFGPLFLRQPHALPCCSPQCNARLPFRPQARGGIPGRPNLYYEVYLDRGTGDGAPSDEAMRRMGQLVARIPAMHHLLARMPVRGQGPAGNAGAEGDAAQRWMQRLRGPPGYAEPSGGFEDLGPPPSTGGRSLRQVLSTAEPVDAIRNLISGLESRILADSNLPAPAPAPARQAGAGRVPEGWSWDAGEARREMMELRELFRDRERAALSGRVRGERGREGEGAGASGAGAGDAPRPGQAEGGGAAPGQAQGGSSGETTDAAPAEPAAAAGGATPPSQPQQVPEQAGAQGQAEEPEQPGQASAPSQRPAEAAEGGAEARAATATATATEPAAGARARVGGPMDAGDEEESEEEEDGEGGDAIDPAFLDALPPDLRAEVLATHRLQMAAMRATDALQRRSERAARERQEAPGSGGGEGECRAGRSVWGGAGGVFC